MVNLQRYWYACSRSTPIQKERKTKRKKSLFADTFWYSLPVKHQGDQLFHLPTYLLKQIERLKQRRSLAIMQRVVNTGKYCHISLHKKATIHQVTTMLATSKNVLFPGHNHLLTTGGNDLTLIIAQALDGFRDGFYITIWEVSTYEGDTLLI